MNQKYFLITGQLTWVLGFAAFACNSFYWGTNAAVAFAAGLLMGLSLPMNLAYLITRRKRILNTTEATQY